MPFGKLLSSRAGRETDSHSALPEKIWLAVAILMVAVASSNFASIGKTPDSEMFLALAQNMIENLCFSTSPPSSGVCQPVWSQQPPGYAFFIASIWLLAGASDRAIVVAQTFLFAISALYFARWLFAVHRSSLLFHVSLITALMSPIVIGHSRMVLTELLTAASMLWVMTELLRTMLDGTSRHLRIAIAVSTGMLMRWDQITLLVPVAVTLVYAFGCRFSVRPMIIIASLCALPYLALAVRASVVGLPLVPSTNSELMRVPPGFMAFYRVAALDDGATNTLWNFVGRNYVQIDPERTESYTTRLDASELRRLLMEAKRLPVGSEAPAWLDNEFARIARQLSGNPFEVHIYVPAIRAYRMWSRWLGHPVVYSSLGQKAPLKQLLALYSIVVLVGTLAAAVLCSGSFRVLAIAGLSLAAARTAFLVVVPVSAMEIRYLDPLFPSLDMISICALWLLVRQRMLVAPLAPE